MCLHRYRWRMEPIAVLPFTQRSHSPLSMNFHSCLCFDRSTTFHFSSQLKMKFSICIIERIQKQNTNYVFRMFSNWRYGLCAVENRTIKSMKIVCFSFKLLYLFKQKMFVLQQSLWTLFMCCFWEEVLRNGAPPTRRALCKTVGDTASWMQKWLKAFCMLYAIQTLAPFSLCTYQSPSKLPEMKTFQPFNGIGYVCIWVLCFFYYIPPNGRRNVCNISEMRPFSINELIFAIDFSPT